MRRENDEKMRIIFQLCSTLKRLLVSGIAQFELFFLLSSTNFNGRSSCTIIWKFKESNFDFQQLFSRSFKLKKKKNWSIVRVCESTDVGITFYHFLSKLQLDPLPTIVHICFWADMQPFLPAVLSSKRPCDSLVDESHLKCFPSALFIGHSKFTVIT